MEDLLKSLKREVKDWEYNDEEYSMLCRKLNRVKEILLEKAPLETCSECEKDTTEHILCPKGEGYYCSSCYLRHSHYCRYCGMDHDCRDVSKDGDSLACRHCLYK